MSLSVSLFLLLLASVRCLWVLLCLFVCMCLCLCLCLCVVFVWTSVRYACVLDCVCVCMLGSFACTEIAKQSRPKILERRGRQSEPRVRTTARKQVGTCFYYYKGITWSDSLDTNMLLLYDTLCNPKSLLQGVCPKTIGVCPGFARGLPRGLPTCL